MADGGLRAAMLWAGVILPWGRAGFGAIVFASSWKTAHAQPVDA
ncbi:hypothetical protein [Hirschia litorea]|uniref:Uncharacterized protein n=1 Tax=Hirschia litorea TaxID=1199156 RepID=A0ABW2IP91_9PROT